GQGQAGSGGAGGSAGGAYRSLAGLGHSPGTDRFDCDQPQQHHEQLQQHLDNKQQRNQSEPATPSEFNGLRGYPAERDSERSADRYQHEEYPKPGSALRGRPGG